MTTFDEPNVPEDDDLDLLNPGGEAADEEADLHGDRLAEPDHLPQGDDEA